MMNMLAYSQIPKTSTVLDIGAKYHKLDDYLTKSSFNFKMTKIIANRAPIYAYDR